MLDLQRYFQEVWTSTNYDSFELTRFAREKTTDAARQGLAAMSLLTIAILLIEAMLYYKFGMDPMYLYTCGVLIILALNILVSSRSVNEYKALHMLGITLLVVSGTAFVLLAHYQHLFHPMLFASVALLFMVIPMMPWGLREALGVTLLIYLMFTLSTLGAHFNFSEQSLWTLQFIMVGTGIVSLSIVVRNVQIRKHDLETQHELVVANECIADLSNRDPLTGAWNRRFFEHDFDQFIDKCREHQNQINFMLIDVDDFKEINDEFGHEIGDQVLQSIARAFLNLTADSGHMVRIGGDEFVLIFADLDPLVIARRGLRQLREYTCDSKYKKVNEVSLSIGVASAPAETNISYHQLYKQADLAMYKAKSEKGADPSSPNIVVSELHDPEDLLLSTQSLWKMKSDERGGESAA